jgi:hypothetical protein
MFYLPHIYVKPAISSVDVCDPGYYRSLLFCVKRAGGA